ncbi:hypothetical protein LCGC14_0798550 [marine sediment metagenome]|uniref:Uncharacterized protein n=1 Tax=marine sediment metagenome TaxID=412755 RepID=A0A0F9QA55_9ZZZZ
MSEQAAEVSSDDGNGVDRDVDELGTLQAQVEDHHDCIEFLELQALDAAKSLKQAAATQEELRARVKRRGERLKEAEAEIARLSKEHEELAAVINSMVERLQELSDRLNAKAE